MAELSFSPASSNVESVSFDDSTDTLTVVFQGGVSYEYLNCPASVYRAFQAAPSAGAFVHRHLKGRYQYNLL